MTVQARYPRATIYNPSGNTAFTNAYIGYAFTNSSGCADTAYSAFQVSPCTGIAENSLSGIRICPNPAGDQVVIQSGAGGLADIRITLADCSGRTIVHENLS